jgi:outer membrane protein assembly factor BamB
LQWSASENVAWRQPIPGEGWSSPVVSGNRVILTTALERDGRLVLQVLCLNTASGALLWEKDVFFPAPSDTGQLHRKNSHASSTPVIEEDRIYVHFGHYGTACLSIDGEILWKNETLKYPPIHGNGGSPILVGDLLIFSADGGKDPFLAALEKRTGRVRWKVPRQTDATRTFSFSTPLLITVAGQPQVISPGSNMVGAYDPATGEEIWRVRYEGYSVVPRPVYGHGLIYISTGYDRPSVLAVRVNGRGDVTDSHVAWRVSRGAPNTPSLLLVGEELYLLSDSGIASCLDARTGEQHWQERIGGDCSASPLFGAGRIYLQNEAGLGVVLKPGKDFEKLSSNALEERTLASYAALEGAFFIRTAEHLLRIGVPLP